MKATYYYRARFKGPLQNLTITDGWTTAIRNKSPQSVQIQCSLELIAHWVVNGKVGRGGLTRIFRNK